jgi:hypothetical protein
MAVDWKSMKVSHDTMAAFTSPHAVALVAQAGFRPTLPGPLRILENAAGTGVGTEAILAALGDRGKEQDVTILAGDVSTSLLEVLEARKAHLGWNNVDVQVIDAMDTKLPTAYFTHVFTSFGIVPDQMKALRGMSALHVYVGSKAEHETDRIYTRTYFGRNQCFFDLGARRLVMGRESRNRSHP